MEKRYLFTLSFEAGLLCQSFVSVKWIYNSTGPYSYNNCGDACRHWNAVTGRIHSLGTFCNGQSFQQTLVASCCRHFCLLRHTCSRPCVVVACKPPRSPPPEWHKGPLWSYCRRPSEVRIESVRKVYQSIFTLRRIAWKQVDRVSRHATGRQNRN